MFSIKEGQAIKKKKPSSLPLLAPYQKYTGVNKFIAIKLQTPPKYRLRKCTEGKKRATK